MLDRRDRGAHGDRSVRDRLVHGAARRRRSHRQCANQSRAPPGSALDIPSNTLSHPALRLLARRLFRRCSSRAHLHRVRSRRRNGIRRETEESNGGDTSDGTRARTSRRLPSGGAAALRPRSAACLERHGRPRMRIKQGFCVVLPSASTSPERFRGARLHQSSCASSAGRSAPSCSRASRCFCGRILWQLRVLPPT